MKKISMKNEENLNNSKVEISNRHQSKGDTNVGIMIQRLSKQQ